MCRSAEGNADHTRLFSLYLSTKRLYKQAVDHARSTGMGNFIDNAANPCKAAWNVINSNRNKKTAYMCPASPDELNQYFISLIVVLALSC